MGTFIDKHEKKAVMDALVFSSCSDVIANWDTKDRLIMAKMAKRLHDDLGLETSHKVKIPITQGAGLDQPDTADLIKDFTACDSRLEELDDNDKPNTELCLSQNQVLRIIEALAYASCPHVKDDWFIDQKTNMAKLAVELSDQSGLRPQNVAFNNSNVDDILTNDELIGPLFKQKWSA
jgi:hypothetical protein